MASAPRKSNGRVRLYSRPGNDFTRRFPLIVEALERLRSRSCIIDGEAVACDDNGVASFDLIRHHRANGSVFLFAFDLIELNGDDRRGVIRLRSARPRLRACWPRLAPASGSTSISRATARACLPTLAKWGWKASCRSGRTPPIAAADRPIGSR